MSTVDRALMQASAGERLALILSGYESLAGERLAPDDGALWEARFAVVAHGTESPPLFFYANRIALELFAMPARRFIGMESARSAEPQYREERAEMLEGLEASDIVTGYSGIRVAADGKRFRIEDAVIWNLRDEWGTRRGQAAMFAKWRFLPD